jgi:hypothetical protein
VASDPHRKGGSSIAKAAPPGEVHSLNATETKLPPPHAITPTPTVPIVDEGPKLGLQQFAINSSDSLYEKCYGDDCSEPAWKDGIPQFQPTPEAILALSLLSRYNYTDPISAFYENPALVQKKAKEVRNFHKTYKARRSYLRARLLPVFDVVVTNGGHQPAVLTDIEIVVLDCYPYVAGDGFPERSTVSHVVNVLHPDLITLGDDYDTYDDHDKYKGPIVFSAPATPPISVAMNDAARYQISFKPTDSRYWWYELRLQFHFGGKEVLKTETFRVTV